MALDVYVEVDEDPLLILSGLPKVAFNDSNEGYFWCLYPSFERLASTTGLLVDLYDLVTFAGDLLPPLKDMLAEAQQSAGTQPETWDVLTGWRGERAAQNAIHATVKCAELEHILADLQRMTDAAIAGRGRVVFYGD